MKLKEYTSEDFYKARCVKCSWVQEQSYKVLPKKLPVRTVKQPDIHLFQETKALTYLAEWCISLTVITKR